MIKLIESWLIELLKGLGRIFLNPLFYWSIILVFLVGNKRIKQERRQFGTKVFDLAFEWKITWKLSLLVGLLISLITLGIGIVFSYDIILLLSLVTILLTLTFNYSLLSPSYTIGITFILIVLSPLILENQSLIDPGVFNQINYSGLTILLGLFLLVEALLLRRTHHNETFPELSLSERGAFIGRHRLKKLSIIPFFVIIPTGMITPFAPYWPFFEIGGESFSLLLVPFLIGFNHVVRGKLPKEVAIKLAKSMTILGLIVLALALGSIYKPLSSLTLVAVVIAIIGREYINYKHRITDGENSPFFSQLDDGIRVLGVIPHSPADRLGILVGEKIVKVNSKKINDVHDFYRLLRDNGVNFKLDVIDDANEIRYVQSALYDGDHHKIGITFTEKPFRN